jgi:hypothetical protein
VLLAPERKDGAVAVVARVVIRVTVETAQYTESRVDQTLAVVVVVELLIMPVIAMRSASMVVA